MDPRIADTRIRLVRNDTGPQIRLVILDESTGNVQDLTGATAQLHFRAVDGPVLFSVPLVIPAPTAADGVAIVVWDAGDLDQPEGYYEGEVEVLLGSGIRQTVYEPLRFHIRDDYA